MTQVYLNLEVTLLEGGPELQMFLKSLLEKTIAYFITFAVQRKLHKRRENVYNLNLQIPFLFIT